MAKEQTRWEDRTYYTLCKLPHRAIEEYFENGSRFGVKIEYARSDRPLATAGQLKTAEKYLTR